MNTKRSMPAPTYFARSLTELIDLRASEYGCCVTFFANAIKRSSLMIRLYTLAQPNLGPTSKR